MHRLNYFRATLVSCAVVVFLSTARHCLVLGGILPHGAQTVSIYLIGFATFTGIASKVRAGRLPWFSHGPENH